MLSPRGEIVRERTIASGHWYRRMFPLFSAPASPAFIDDDENFLFSMSVYLRKYPQLRTFTEVDEFSAAASNSIEMLRHEQQTLFSLVEAQTAGESVVPAILRYLSTAQRFDILTILVADHHMPKMLGIELLGRLQAPGLRRVLLTGVADNQEAINAFNAHKIEAYVPKQASAMPQQVQAMLDTQASEAAAQRGAILIQAFSSGQAQALRDPAVCAALQQALHRVGALEHIVLGYPFGVLAVDPVGKVWWLQLDDQDSVAAQLDLLVALPAAQQPPNAAAAAEQVASGEFALNSHFAMQLPGQQVQVVPTHTAGTTANLRLSTFEISGLPADLAPLAHMRWLSSRKGV